MYIDNAVVDYGTRFHVQVDDDGVRVISDGQALFFDPDTFRDIVRLAVFQWGENW